MEKTILINCKLPQDVHEVFPELDAKLSEYFPTSFTEEAPLATLRAMLYIKNALDYARVTEEEKDYLTKNVCVTIWAQCNGSV